MKYLQITFRITAPDTRLEDVSDLLADLSAEAGLESFEAPEPLENNAMILKGYAQESLFDKAALDAAIKDFPFAGATITYDVSKAEDKDWNEDWEQQGFEPIVIDNRCIIHDGRHLPENAGKDTVNPPIQIEIDARQAFGTGNHETTRMIVTRLLDSDVKGKTVLDAGCGTGILSIAALKLGAARATAYDIDEWSSDNTRHNAVINHVDDRLEIITGDSDVIASRLDEFDIITANINRNVLLADLSRFTAALKHGGQLILSGFYTTDIPCLSEAAADEDLTPVKTLSENDWACLTFQKD